MPRLSAYRQPMNTASLTDDPEQRTITDALTVNGIDAGAAHRARIRAMNTDAQAARAALEREHIARCERSAREAARRRQAAGTTEGVMPPAQRTHQTARG